MKIYEIKEYWRLLKDLRQTGVDHYTFESWLKENPCTKEELYKIQSMLSWFMNGSKVSKDATEEYQKLALNK